MLHTHTVLEGHVFYLPFALPIFSLNTIIIIIYSTTTTSVRLLRCVVIDVEGLGGGNIACVNIRVALYFGGCLCHFFFFFCLAFFLFSLNAGKRRQINGIKYADERVYNTEWVLVGLHICCIGSVFRADDDVGCGPPTATTCYCTTPPPFFLFFFVFSIIFTTSLCSSCTLAGGRSCCFLVDVLPGIMAEHLLQLLYFFVVFIFVW